MKHLLVLVCTLLISACSVEEVPSPSGPDGSWWLGGADGGVFLSVEKVDGPSDDSAATFTGTIYFEGDQRVWYGGDFELVDQMSFNPADKSQYQFWDGERLHLSGGGYLKPLGEIPPL